MEIQNKSIEELLEELLNVKAENEYLKQEINNKKNLLEELLEN